jgi:glycosyltransferase involved in cell wall biosynthesis
MRQLIQKENIDLIHSHLPDQNFYSCLAGRLTGRKVVVTYHGAPTAGMGMRGAIKSWTVRHNAAAIVVVSDFLKGLLVSAGFPVERMTRIYNGINMDLFVPGAGSNLRRELGLADNTKLIGMVANLRESKGYEHFVQAARRVSDSIPEARFFAVGQRDEAIAKRVEALVRELNLERTFFFLGFRPDVAEILNSLDLFVLSSVSEGLSIATIEAMAAGKPVVVTRSGGPQEIVEDGRTGILVPPSDSGALASKICELLGNPRLAATLSRNARIEVEGKFSLTKMVSEYESLYERCLGSV